MMNPRLLQILPACFKRTTNALRWIGVVCASVFAVVFFLALASALAQPAFNGGMLIGLGILAFCILGSCGIYWQAQRVQKRLQHAFFEAPQSIERIEAKIIMHGPIAYYIIHLHPKKPGKLVGLNVPNQAVFESLRTLLPLHFTRAERVGMP